MLSIWTVILVVGMLVGMNTEFQRAVSLFQRGQWESGWREIEANMPLHAITGPKEPWWRGEKINGNLGVYNLQGYGDLFQYMRFLVAARDKFTGFHCLTNQPGPECAAYTELMFLPRAAGICNPADAPQPPYVFAEDSMRQKWAARMSHIGGCRVGICWQNDPNHTMSQRAIPLCEFLPLAETPGVSLISLQKHHGVEQLQGVIQVTDLGSQLDNDGHPFVDTTAAIANLDLVITCDSAIAHLAGGLGKPTWVALPSVPDWRWGIKGESTPWYPNMRLFRQERLGDWATVFHGIETELRRIVG